MRAAWVVLLAGACGGTPAPIDEVLDGVCERRLPKPGTDETGDLHRATVTDSPGTCNDGSPPVTFVRAGTPEHAADWVLAFQGGGSCASYDECTARWCHLDFYDATWMSSRFDPPTAHGKGILADEPDNGFAGWNVVELRYCSSDLWLGTAPAAELHGLLRGYTLAFEGDLVVDGMLASLDAGASSDDGLVAMPSLGDAARIVVVGESAGGVGALQHVDGIARRYPDADVWGVIDGGTEPARRVLPPDLQDRADEVDTKWGRDVFRGLWEGRGDPSCTGTDCWRAEALVPTDLADTPLVVRQDELDPSRLRDYHQVGVTDGQYAQFVADTLDWFASRRADSSFLASRCGIHIVTTGPEYATAGARDAGGGPARTMRDLVEGMVFEGEREVVVAAPGAEPACVR